LKRGESERGESWRERRGESWRERRGEKGKGFLIKYLLDFKKSLTV
jgi:hypothetical protein